MRPRVMSPEAAELHIVGQFRHSLFASLFQMSWKCKNEFLLISVSNACSAHSLRPSQERPCIHPARSLSTTYSFSSSLFYFTATSLCYRSLVDSSSFTRILWFILVCSCIALDRRPGPWPPRSLWAARPPTHFGKGGSVTPTVLMGVLYETKWLVL